MSYTNGLDKPTDYFTTFLWTGDGSTSPRSHTGVGLQADMMWSKIRSSGHQHNLVDTVRGVDQRLLMPSDNGDEDTTCTHGHFDSLDSDGFTTTNGGGNWNVNASGQTYVGWFWKAGTSFTNDASSTGIGTIDSTGSASDTSGFSIVSYTATGSTGTLKHGLSSAPSMIIIKNRSVTKPWQVGHKSLGFQNGIYLNETSASQSDNGAFNSTNPTTSVFTIETSSYVNTSGHNYIAYCFAEKKGYSKFGSYTGNGNADGSFIYTGFQPAFVMVKRNSDTGNWNMMDTARSPSNIVGLTVSANSSGADDGGDFIDILSNGFKQRSTSTNRNASGSTYIYMAFAESPFVTSTGIPTTAR